MRLTICNDYQDMSQKAAAEFIELLKEKPDCTLGLATGSSPIGLYQNLIKAVQDGAVSFAKVKTYNLDEYVGLTADHDQSYAYFMRQNLFDHVDIPAGNTDIPSGSAPDTAAECRRYTAALAAIPGGQDIQLIGIGNNGHIGFNEPDVALSADTHEVTLSPSTIEANARFFASVAEVPKSAVTMGMRGILAAKKIVLVATGSGKAAILKQALYGPITTQVPASLLQLHPNVVIFADRDAAAEL